jgi:hypothetical protein
MRSAAALSTLAATTSDVAQPVQPPIALWVTRAVGLPMKTSKKEPTPIAWIDNYCRLHAFDGLPLAVEALVNELTNWARDRK